MPSPERYILVVDDEPFIVHYVRQVLQRSNYGAVTANTAKQAWTIFEQREVRVGLLLTDIVMPGSMDGLDLAAKIRQVERTFPILFMTEKTDSGGRSSSCGDHGRTLTVTKTFLSKTTTRFPQPTFGPRIPIFQPVGTYPRRRGCFARSAE